MYIRPLHKNALKNLDEALSTVEKKNDRFFESEFYRLKGVCLLKNSAENEKEAEVCFNHALDISRSQGAKALELRAATSWASLCQQQGKPEEVRHLLEAVYNWFTEGFDTHDLQAVRSLLASLLKIASQHSLMSAGPR